MSHINWNDRLCFEPRVAKGGLGLPADDDRNWEFRGRELVGLVEKRRAAKKDLGFLDLPETMPSTAAKCRDYIAHAREHGLDTMLVLGIGGSSLGGRMLQEALAPATAAASTRPRAAGTMRVLFADSLDPDTFATLLASVDCRKTCVNVISKSGSTAETLAQFLICRERWERETGPNWHHYFCFTTDPVKGPLRQIAGQHHIRSFEVPPNVGGRFSVLSAVGLLPAAAMGIDLAELLAGAGRTRDLCLRTDPLTNPALRFALMHLKLKDRGLTETLMWPYVDRLRSFGLWFAQLWAESLGKSTRSHRAKLKEGFTPVLSLGAADQHSQLQLYLESPARRLAVVIGQEQHLSDPRFPSYFNEFEEIAYLPGHTLGALQEAERQATVLSLAQNGTPVIQISIDSVSPRVIGDLIMLFEAATVLTGEGLGLDAMDQPAVEQGKRYAMGTLGRKGYEQYRLAADATK